MSVGFCLCDVQKVSTGARPLWFVFIGLGCQWAKMGKDLMALDCFRETIMRLDALMKQYDFHLYDVLVNSTDETFHDVVNSLTSIVAVEVISHV